MPRPLISKLAYSHSKKPKELISLNHSPFRKDAGNTSPPKSTVSKTIQSFRTRNENTGQSKRLIQRMCGRWLAWRRLRMCLSSQTIEQRTGISVEVLTLLEQGLANVQDLTRDERIKLCNELLDDQVYKQEWVSTMIDAALGEVEFLHQDIASRVTTDLSPNP